MLWCGAHYNRSSSAKNKSYQSDKHYEKNKCIPCRTLHSVHGDVRYDITNFNLVVLAQTLNVVNDWGDDASLALSPKELLICFC